MPRYRISYNVYAIATAMVEASTLQEAEALANTWSSDEFDREDYEWDLDREYNAEYAIDHNLPRTDADLVDDEEIEVVEEEVVDNGTDFFD